MRLLADENIPKSVVDALRASGHNVLWARTDCAGWNDTALLDRAESEARILLTLDKDFWQIAMQRRHPLICSGIILFRVFPATPDFLQPLVRAFLDGNKVWAGHVSIVSSDRIQMLAVKSAL